MSLTFENATTDNVDYGNAAACDDLDPGSYVFWLKRNAGSVGTTLFSKRNERPSVFSQSGAGRPFNFRWQAATTDMNIQTDQDQPDGSWAFWVATVDTGDSQDMRWWYGTESAVVAETGYTITTNSSGAFDSNVGKPLVLGNTEAKTNGWPGDIALFAVFNRVLTLGEKIQMQFAPRPLSGCCHFSVPGLVPGDTATQPDWSGNGNQGTASGTVRSDPFHFGPLWGFDGLTVSGAAAAGGATVPIFVNSYRRRRMTA